MAVCLVSLTGCNGGEGKREFISVGTAPIGGVFYTVGLSLIHI